MLRLTRTGFALVILGSALLVATVAKAAAPTNDSADPSTGECADMMGGTEGARKAMQEFMKSERAPHAMTNMMDMARRMNNSGGSDHPYAQAPAK